MKIQPPSPEIIQDLLTDNWHLRWQVIDLMHRVNLAFRDHARSSREQAACHHLGRRLTQTLSGPGDPNLHLVFTTAWFLGGYPFVFMLFNQLGIDDRDEFYPQISQLKKEICKPSARASLGDYFSRLLSSRETAVELTTSIAASLTIRLFPPEKALNLLSAIPDSEIRFAALEEFRRICSGPELGSYLLQHLEILQENLPLLGLLRPPLSDKLRQRCLELVRTALESGDRRLEGGGLEAVRNLKLNEILPRLRKPGAKNPEYLCARAHLGETEACEALLGIGRSWRARSRCRAFAGLAACENPEAIALLRKSARRGDREERGLALSALALNPSLEALETLFELLRQTRDPETRRLLLRLVARHPRSGIDPEKADLLAGCYDEHKLDPELFRALERFGPGTKWPEIVNRFRPPLSFAEQETALALARFYPDCPKLRPTLTKLLFDLDWSFSCRLFRRLSPHLAPRDLELILRFIRFFEEDQALSISERLKYLSEIEDFSEAMCLFLNQRPDTGRLLLKKIVQHLVQDGPPLYDLANSHFRQQPVALQKLILGLEDETEIEAGHQEVRLPLLVFVKFLTEISLPGGSAESIIVNRTRKYRGFFREAVCELLESWLDDEPGLHETTALPRLNQLLDLLRQRPGYDKLREKLIEHLAAVQRKSRELKIFINIARNRDLRVIKVRHIHSSSPPETRTQGK